MSLREVAEAATPGPWHQDAPMMSQRDERYVGMGPRGDGYRSVVAAPDAATAEFIATFDPPTVLALLDVVEAAGHAVYGADDLVHRMADLREALARLPEEVRK